MQNKRKPKTSYSAMGIQEAERRLGVEISNLGSMSVDRMLANTKRRPEGADVDATKEKVYDQILDYLYVEGYPTMANPDFTEANVHDLVYAIITPIIRELRHKTGRNIRLARKKEIISKGDEAEGTEEVVVTTDRISVSEKKFVLIVEAHSVGEAMKRCLLLLKDARDNNGEGEVYGFVTTGQMWQMIRYDGASFTMTRVITAVFGGMDEDRVEWVRGSLVLVDCVIAASSNGGVAKKGT